MPGERKLSDPMPLSQARFRLFGEPLMPIRLEPVGHGPSAGTSALLVHGGGSGMTPTRLRPVLKRYSGFVFLVSVSNSAPVATKTMGNIHPSLAPRGANGALHSLFLSKTPHVSQRSMALPIFGSTGSAANQQCSTVAAPRMTDTTHPQLTGRGDTASSVMLHYFCT